MHTFTPAQTRFLESYLAEFEEPVLLSQCQEFTAHTLKLRFDGIATLGEIKVAKNLQAKGIVGDYEHHRAGTVEHLAINFTEQGAQALWRLGQIHAGKRVETAQKNQ